MRHSQSFSTEEAAVTKFMCECATRGMPIPISVMRNPAFAGVYRKMVAMVEVNQRRELAGLLEEVRTV